MLAVEKRALPEDFFADDVRIVAAPLVLFVNLFAAAFRATALFAELLLTVFLVGTVRFFALCAVARGRVAARCGKAFVPGEDALFFAPELCARDREELDLVAFVFGAAPLFGEVLWVVTMLDIGSIGTAASRASAQTRQPQVKSARARMEA